MRLLKYDVNKAIRINHIAKIALNKSTKIQIFGNKLLFFH